MKKFKMVDTLMGWLTFLVAAFVYCSTIEPTASFWDCPEFITTGYKMEIGHPPGAPFFMLTANLFSHFASDPTQVAKMVNTMSALLSALTILFLFWTITHLAKKLIVKDWNNVSLAKIIAIEGAGLVGALIYTFSDTFWFSAVEGEVYAFSSALTATVFWLILKWEDHADEPHSDRWLVLISYIVGISIGVHLLNLLCIPAIVLVYVYRKYPNIEVKGSLLALLGSFVIIAAVLYGIVPGIVTVGGWFELFFVNTLHCPFNTGLIIYVITLIAIVLWAIYESYVGKSQMRSNISFMASVAMLGIPFYGYGWKAVVIGIVVLAVLWYVLNFSRTIDKKRVALIGYRVKNTVLLCMLMVMIGYSSYALVIIRSTANPPMDQNSPEDIFTLGSYLSRDQYGDRPLFYGPAYNSQVQLDVDGNICRPRQSEGAPIYQRKEKTSPDEKDSYFVVSHKTTYVYAQNMLFPRMYSERHKGQYESWLGGVDGKEIPYNRCGENIFVKMPTQMENLRFFLSYQCNFMYWRYFMWNFAGRQNDCQGNGELEHGNWITGISWFDNWRLGDQSKLPDSLKANKGHNVFYCLPLLLGLLGLFWQAWRGKRGIRQFWVVFFLFFMTGLAIVVYLNQTPSQPRERDYAYAGSFYAFAIWCGLGVTAIIDLVKKYLKLNETLVAAVVACLAVLVPVQMASQTWDDHDRSGRYTCRDFGQNYLMSLQKKGNPIIFTNGDNDTFPLWYEQEVEGVRTDARVCNLSYIQTDWYIDQMKRPAYDSPSLPITWPRLDFCSGTNEYIEVQPAIKQQLLQYYKDDPISAKQQFGDEPFELKNIIKYWVRSKNSEMHVFPTDTVYITIDKEAVRKSGMLMPTDSIPDKMVVSLAGKRALYKGELMMLEMLAQSNWTRPLYVATTVGAENYMNLGDNFIKEGLANRITPFITKNGVRSFDTERVYDNVMNKFKFGNLRQKGLYLEETTRRMCYTHRRLMTELAMNLINEKQIDKAKKVMEKCEVEIPEYNVPIDFISGGLDMANIFAILGQKDKAKRYLDLVWKDARQYLDYYMQLSSNRFQQSHNECMTHFYALQRSLEVYNRVDQKARQEHELEFNNLAVQYQSKGGTFNQ